MATRVYMGGISHRCREKDIEYFFRKYGKIRWEVCLFNYFIFLGNISTVAVFSYPIHVDRYSTVRTFSLGRWKVVVWYGDNNVLAYQVPYCSTFFVCVCRGFVLLVCLLNLISNVYLTEDRVIPLFVAQWIVFHRAESRTVFYGIWSNVIST